MSDKNIEMADDHPKIMVVDDDQGMLITLEGIIEDDGFDVIGVADGYQAIESAKGTHFSLILMDIRMPGINGVETYREIKRISPDSVVVMMTGFSVEELVKDALEEGAYAVIYKPFDARQIIDMIHTALRTSLVLLVDDQAADRETLRAILGENGYQIFEADSGQQAIDMAVERYFDIILMSIRMPGMDGVTVLEVLRRIDPLTKVIFITGYELEDPVREAVLAGAYSVIMKPVDPEELLALMRSIVGREGSAST